MESNSSPDNLPSRFQARTLSQAHIAARQAFYPRRPPPGPRIHSHSQDKPRCSDTPTFDIATMPARVLSSERAHYRPTPAISRQPGGEMLADPPVAGSLRPKPPRVHRHFSRTQDVRFTRSSVHINGRDRTTDASSRSLRLRSSGYAQLPLVCAEEWPSTHASVAVPSGCIWGIPERACTSECGTATATHGAQGVDSGLQVVWDVLDEQRHESELSTLLWCACLGASQTAGTLGSAMQSWTLRVPRILSRLCDPRKIVSFIYFHFSLHDLPSLMRADKLPQAVLLLRPNVPLYSTDALPINCSAYSPSPESSSLCASSPPEFSSATRTCECLTQTLCCHGCGSAVGYTIVSPCRRCTSSISASQRATNGHRFVFYAKEVDAEERRYVPGEHGVLSEQPRPPLMPPLHAMRTMNRLPLRPSLTRASMPAPPPLSRAQAVASYSFGVDYGRFYACTHFEP